MTCKINDDCLAILRYDDENLKNKLILDYRSIELLFNEELCDYKSLIMEDDRKRKYTLSDIKKLEEFLSNTLNLKQLNMKYRYCESLSGTFEGFTVDIENDIKNIQNLVIFIQGQITNRELSLCEDNKLSQLQHDFEGIELGFVKFHKEHNIHKNMDIHEWIHKVSKIVIESYYEQLEIWAKAFSIQKKYRELFNSKEILFFSHRINGWANPVCTLNNGLSAEYKTNFGYGRSSYFYLKLTYNDIEIIPFTDLIKYEYAGFFEINQYTQKYDLIENDDWDEALRFLADAYNLLMEDEKQFIEKYMVSEIKKLVNELGKLMERTHFEFIGPKVDIETGEITIEKIKKKYKDKSSELIIFRARKITNSLDFIIKIKEYKQLMEINSAVSEIENFNKNIKHVLQHEIEITDNEIKNLKISMAEIQPIFTKMKKRDEGYQNKKLVIRIKILNDTTFDGDITEKVEEALLTQDPEYKQFSAEYKPVRDEFFDLNKQYMSNIHILKQLNDYHKKIHDYFECK